MHPYLVAAQATTQQTIDLIRALVECESPTGDRGGIHRVLTICGEFLADSCQITIFPQDGQGDHALFQFDSAGAPDKGGILVLAHSDTVWPVGTLSKMPFRQESGRLWGPGVLDMKSGIACFLSAVMLLRNVRAAVKRPISLLVVSDEETGSHTSRSITEAEALKNKLVLVLEPGTGLDGKLKTSRKGVGRYRLQIQGRASHAGVDFEAGSSAVLELARQIIHVNQLVDLENGVTLNVGLVRGGSASNVVAGGAEAEIDVRVNTSAQAAALDRALRASRPVDERCTIIWSGGVNRPPMERTAAIASLFLRAHNLGRELDLNLEESSTGGGSDGNFTAALGIPTLDGLGGVGEGAHAPHESVLVERLPDRVALLAALLTGL